MKENMKDIINNLCKDTLVENLGIEFIEYTGDKVVAEMPVDRRTMRPGMMLHGGASMALAETVGSSLSYMSVSPEDYNVFGIEINGNHVSSVKSGKVRATASFIHKGKTTHVVGIKITDEKGKIVSVCRITNIIIPKKK